MDKWVKRQKSPDVQYGEMKKRHGKGKKENG
jgi:hypothetical protein